MDVARQHRREVAWYIGGANDVGCGGKGVVRGADRCAFDALVNAQQPMAGAHIGESCAGHQVRKPGAHGVAFGWKAGQRHAGVPDFHDEGSRTVEDMDPRMLCEPEVRDTATLVIARNDKHGHAAIGDSRQWLERLPDDVGGRSRSVEYIPAVDHDVHLACQRRMERRGIVCQEVVASPPADDARIDREVEAQVRVRDEQDPDRIDSR